MSESAFNFANLMDLATVDTSDLSAQTSRLQRQGIYVLELSSLGFKEQPPADPANPMNYNLVTIGKVLAFDALDPTETGPDQIGKDLRERIPLFGENMQESLQLLMGRFKTAGFKHKGIMGGVEGAPLGWIDEAVGKRIAIRVRHYDSAKTGQTNVAIDWLSPKQMEKAQLPWEVLEREFLDEVGNPVDLAA